MKYKAVVFDLDGTLLDTLDDLADSMNSALESRGLPTHSTKEYKYFVGDGVEKLVERTLPKDLRTPDTIQELLLINREEYSRRWDNKTKPYDGIPELLDKLLALRVKTAVLSNKPHEFTVLTVEKLLPGQSFDIVLGVKPGALPKPDPAGATELCKDLGIAPEEILYLGDTNTDMLTANAAGMYAVGALWGFRDAAELLEAGAKTLIAHPTDLLELL